MNMFLIFVSVCVQVDSIDVWPYLSGEVKESPRTDFLLLANVLVMMQRFRIILTLFCFVLKF
jgi:hypothetical protein